MFSDYNNNNNNNDIIIKTFWNILYLGRREGRHDIGNENGFYWPSSWVVLGQGLLLLLLLQSLPVDRSRRQIVISDAHSVTLVAPSSPPAHITAITSRKICLYIIYMCTCGSSLLVVCTHMHSTCNIIIRNMLYLCCCNAHECIFFFFLSRTRAPSILPPPSSRRRTAFPPLPRGEKSVRSLVGTLYRARHWISENLGARGTPRILKCFWKLFEMDFF